MEFANHSFEDTSHAYNSIMSIGSWLSFVSSEIGLKTLFHSSWDVYIIIALRMIRLIGFGSTSLILALYLKTLGVDESYIGFFMTLTFVGDLTTSFLLSLVTDQIGRKRVLVLCSVLMLATGVVLRRLTITTCYLLPPCLVFWHHLEGSWTIQNNRAIQYCIVVQSDWKIRCICLVHILGSVLCGIRIVYCWSGYRYH